MKKETVETLKAMRYADFLQTDYWKMVSEQVKKRANYKCQVCGRSNVVLNAHHNTYEHRGEEYLYMEDLVCLCKDCHNLFTNRKKIQEDLRRKDEEINFLRHSNEISNESNISLYAENWKLFQENESLKEERDSLDLKLRKIYLALDEVRDETEWKNDMGQTVESHLLNNQKDNLPF